LTSLNRLTHSSKPTVLAHSSFHDDPANCENNPTISSQQLLKITRPSTNVRYQAREGRKRTTSTLSLQPVKPHMALGMNFNNRLTANLRASAAEYSTQDVNALLKIVEKYSPVSRRDWFAVTCRFSRWARNTGRPVRTGMSLMLKFNQVCTHQ